MPTTLLPNRRDRQPVHEMYRLEVDVMPHYPLLPDASRRVLSDPRARYPVLTVNGSKNEGGFSVRLRLTPQLAERLAIAARVPVGFLNVEITTTSDASFSVPLPWPRP